MPIAVIVMPASRMFCARLTNSLPSVLPTVGLPSVRRMTRLTVPASREPRRACWNAASSPLYIAVRPLTEIAFTAAATSREFPTRDMGSWTATVSEKDTMEIWSVGRSCLRRPSAAAFACSIFSPSMDPLESIARAMLRFRAATLAGDGVRSTATYTDVPKFVFRDARLTVHRIASGDRFAGRFCGSITDFIFPPGGQRWRGRATLNLSRAARLPQRARRFFGGVFFRLEGTVHGPILHEVVL